MGIVIRVAESDADLEAWRQVRLAVLPNERALAVAEMRAMRTPELTYLIAEIDGVLAGSGLRDPCGEHHGQGAIAPRAARGLTPGAVSR